MKYQSDYTIYKNCTVYYNCILKTVLYTTKLYCNTIYTVLVLYTVLILSQLVLYYTLLVLTIESGGGESMLELLLLCAVELLKLTGEWLELWVSYILVLEVYWSG